ncbi:DUF1549 domain-containing protein, partial [Singulisphaera rosea]
LEDYLHAPEITPALADNLVATGFLRTCVDPTDRPVHNYPPDRAQVLADTIQVVDSTLLGLTIGCARCHSHKYNPITHADYYGLSAVFAAAYTPLEWRTPKQRLEELATKAQRDVAKSTNAKLDLRIAVNKAATESLTTILNRLLFQKKLDQLPEKLRADVRIALAQPEAQRDPVQKYLAEKLGEHFQPKDDELAAAFPKPQAMVVRGRERIAALDAKKIRLPVARALTDTRSDADPFFLLRRGEAYNRGGEVVPDV